MSTDYGLGGPGPVYEFRVDGNGSVDGAVYGQYRAYVLPGEAGDSLRQHFQELVRRHAESQYPCREVAFRGYNYVCTTAIDVTPDWQALWTKLEALGVTSPPPPREDANVICFDGNGLSVEYWGVNRSLRYTLSDCGASRAEQQRQAAIWALLEGVDLVRNLKR